MKVSAALIFLVWIATCAFNLAESQETRFSFERAIMGTIFRIDLFADKEESAKRAAEKAFQAVEEINEIASDYLPQSEITRFNLHPAHQPFQASPHFFDMVSQSLALHRRTHGAFDITADYSIQAWRRAKRQKLMPSDKTLEHAIAMTRISALKLDQQTKTLSKTLDGLRINLGGIGKGYAADLALNILQDLGYPRAMVAGSGDIAIGDPPKGEAGWQITLKTSPHDASPWIVKNCGVSTSGDLNQFFTLHGKTYSHVIDPKTGLGVTHRLSCTVIAPTAALSDSFDNAMCVLGIEKGMEVLAKENLEGRFAQLTPRGQVTVTSTPRFPRPLTQ